MHMYTHIYVYMYMYICIYIYICTSIYIYIYRRFGGSDQPGTRFVSFVRAHAAVCKVRMDLKNDRRSRQAGDQGTMAKKQ